MTRLFRSIVFIAAALVPLFVSAQEVVTITKPRALAAAALQVGESYGWDICYEDVKWQYAGDLQEYTPSRTQSGARQIAPRLDVLRFRENPADRKATIEAMVAAYAAQNGTKFRILTVRNRDILIPEMSRNRNGELQQQLPLLDTHISLPDMERRADETLRAILRTLSEVSGENASYRLWHVYYDTSGISGWVFNFPYHWIHASEPRRQLKEIPYCSRDVQLNQKNSVCRVAPLR